MNEKDEKKIAINNKLKLILLEYKGINSKCENMNVNIVKVLKKAITKDDRCIPTLMKFSLFSNKSNEINLKKKIKSRNDVDIKKMKAIKKELEKKYFKGSFTIVKIIYKDDLETITNTINAFKSKRIIIKDNELNELTEQFINRIKNDLQIYNISVNDAIRELKPIIKEVLLKDKNINLTVFDIADEMLLSNEFGIIIDQSKLHVDDRSLIEDYIKLLKKQQNGNKNIN